MHVLHVNNPPFVTLQQSSAPLPNITEDIVDSANVGQQVGLLANAVGYDVDPGNVLGLAVVANNDTTAGVW
ncbi:MAG: hypothetical protein B7Y33_03075, partial [Hydrogenophilales bacterium 16-62-9]